MELQKIVEVLRSNTIHYTPPVEQLLPFPQLKCSAAGCTAVFTNSSNLMMHLQKHHKIPAICTKKTADIKLFHCPEMTCVYNVSRLNGKYFKCLKYLRQHFQKVHAVKNHVCNKCGKQFGTQGLLKSHQLHLCGKQFKCVQCGLQFGEREALLMHGKRKGHAVLRNGDSTKGIPRLSRRMETVKRESQQTQTEEKRLKAAVAQTDDLVCHSSRFAPTTFANDATETSFISGGSAAIDFSSLFCDIETQTEIPCASTNVTLLDQMLSHSSHMHTQTCDDFLSELGLTDIQTQTNWSSLEKIPTNDHAHDELFVSTETQTSFTQCLLEGSTESTFSGICNTQHTQTCDTLLEGLFGAQESDFMGTFQSTYTQT